MLLHVWKTALGGKAGLTRCLSKKAPGSASSSIFSDSTLVLMLTHHALSVTYGSTEAAASPPTRTDAICSVTCAVRS